MSQPQPLPPGLDQKTQPWLLTGMVNRGDGMAGIHPAAGKSQSHQSRHLQKRIHPLDDGIVQYHRIQHAWQCCGKDINTGNKTIQCQLKCSTGYTVM